MTDGRRSGGVTLTDSTVRTGEARGALAAVPVVPVDAGPTVVAAGKDRKMMFLFQTTNLTDTKAVCQSYDFIIGVLGIHAAL